MGIDTIRLKDDMWAILVTFGEYFHRSVIFEHFVNPVFFSPGLINSVMP